MYKEKRLSAKHKKKRPKTMSKFINPFTDYGFKLIFGREVSKDLLIEFLNDLLEGERVITDLQFLNNEQLPLYPEGRGIIYDVYCTTDTGEKIIVEMQNRMQSNFKERSIYYLSRAIIIRLYHKFRQRKIENQELSHLYHTRKRPRLVEPVFVTRETKE